MKKFSKGIISAVFICCFTSFGFGDGQSPLGDQERARLRAMQSKKDYPAIVKAFADYMIDNGRDTYGKVHSPLFAVVMDRSTGRLFPSPGALPYPNVKVKPFAPGLEREHKMRPSDRTYTGANPVEDLALFEIFYRLTEETRAPRYRDEADKANRWWMANTQSPVTGLYPWGSHLEWDFHADTFRSWGWHEINRPWPYWSLNTEALGVFARGLWDHQIFDKTTGNFNRHAIYHRHGPDKDMEFGWPGASMISTWAEEYALSKDPEMKRAILAVLGRWESLRDPGTGAQGAASTIAPYGNYREQCWAFMNLFAANVIDTAAAVVAPIDPELAGKMREYGRKTDDAFLSHPEDRLDVKRKGLLQHYIIKTGKPSSIAEGKGEIGFPLKDDKGQPAASLDYRCPWFVNRTYAEGALLMWERSKHTVSQNHRERYLQTVLETAEVYMSINPEIQWPVWGDTLAQAMDLLLKAHEQTGNPAYLHRADQFGRLAIELLLDDSSPLPRINSFDGWYECVEKQGASNRWLLMLLEIDAKRRKLPEAQREPPKAIKAGKPARPAATAGDESALFQQRISQAFADGRACVWDCAAKAGASSGQGSDPKMPRDILISYGTNDSKAVYCASLNGSLSANAQGVDADGLDLIISDVICHLPTPEEAAVFNGELNQGFAGKRLGASQAQYGNFKEVLKQAGLLLANYGREAVNVSVTATYHDLYHDNGERTLCQKIEPGKSVLLTFAAPECKLIRRFDIQSDRTGSVKLEQMSFVMASLETFPLLPEPFAGVRPEQVQEGLVLRLSGDSLKEMPGGTAAGEWKSEAGKSLTAVAEGAQRPVVLHEGASTFLRFDGKDDFLRLADNDALDLEAWTLLAVVRATAAPGIVLTKTDEQTPAMNYGLQIEQKGVGAAVRGQTAGNQVNRVAQANLLNRISVIAASFNPTASGVEKIRIRIDDVPDTYSYQKAAGTVTDITHDRPVEIGRQPGREPRYFKGDIFEILLYNRTLSDEEQNSTARWLFERVHGDVAAVAPPGAVAAAQDREKTKDPSKEALVFLIAGQSNAGGVAAFSPETNAKAGLQKVHPTNPGTTAEEVGIPITLEAYPRSYIWGQGFEPLMPGKNLKGGYRDPWRHGIELPMAMLLEKKEPLTDKFFIKHGPGGHNLHTHWAAGTGPDYKDFMTQYKGAMTDLEKRYETVRVIGLYWDQGESDEKQAKAYEANLRALFAALRKDTGIPDLPIYVREQGIFQHDKPEFKPIVAAQIKLCGEDPNAHLLTLDLGTNEKNFDAWAWSVGNGHLSSKAYLELATQIITISEGEKNK